MNTQYIILIAIAAIAGGIGLAVMLLSKRKKKPKPFLFPTIAFEEDEVFVEIENILTERGYYGPDRVFPDIWMVWDVDAHIEPIGSSWRAYQQKYGIEYIAGVYIASQHLIIANRTKYPSLGNLGKLIVHEALHSVGIPHSEESTKLEIELYTILMERMGWKV